MTITYPRALPTSKFLRWEFELEPQDVSTPMQGGEMNTAQIGPSAWVARYEIQTKDRTLAGVIRAWLSSLRGSGRAFFGRDPSYRYPAAYPLGFAGLNRHGGGSFDGTVTGANWSMNGDRDVISLATLPTNLNLRPGDFGMFVWDTDKRSLHRVLDGGAASAGALGVTLEPIVDPRVVPDSAVFSLEAPDCTMRLTKVTPPSIERKFMRFTFEARSFLEP